MNFIIIFFVKLINSIVINLEEKYLWQTIQEFYSSNMHLTFINFEIKVLDNQFLVNARPKPLFVGVSIGYFCLYFWRRWSFMLLENILLLTFVITSVSLCSIKKTSLSLSLSQCTLTFYSDFFLKRRIV